MIDIPTPQPDPGLVAQQQQAQAANTTQIQSSLGQDTQNLWNMFGNGTQMSYISVSQGDPAGSKANGVAASTTGGAAGGGSGPGSSI